METETISARDLRQVTLLPEYCSREVSYELLSKQPIYLADSLVGGGIMRENAITVTKDANSSSYVMDFYEVLKDIAEKGLTIEVEE